MVDVQDEKKENTRTALCCKRWAALLYTLPAVSLHRNTMRPECPKRDHSRPSSNHADNHPLEFNLVEAYPNTAPKLTQPSEQGAINVLVKQPAMSSGNECSREIRHSGAVGAVTCGETHPKHKKFALSVRRTSSTNRPHGAN